MKYRKRALLITRRKGAAAALLCVCIFAAVLLLCSLPFVLLMLVRENASFIYFAAAAGVLAALLCLMLLSALKMGKCRYFYFLARFRTAKPAELFFYFHPKRIFDAVSFCLYSIGQSMLFALLYFLPFAVMLMLFLYNMSESVAVGVMLVNFTGLFLLIFCATAFFGKTKGLFFLAQYLFVSEDILPTDCFFESQKLMSGKVHRLLRLKAGLSFGTLLYILIVPCPFVIRDKNSSLALFASEIIERRN